LSKAELDFEANLEQGGTLIMDTMNLAAKKEEQLPAKETATATTAATTHASTSTSNTDSPINVKRYKSFWPKIFGRKTA
jgi:hypothetical protein